MVGAAADSACCLLVLRCLRLLRAAASAVVAALRVAAVVAAAAVVLAAAGTNTDDRFRRHGRGGIPPRPVSFSRSQFGDLKPQALGLKSHVASERACLIPKTGGLRRQLRPKPRAFVNVVG